MRISEWSSDGCSSDRAEHIDDQVRAAVHNGRYVVELGAGLDIAAEPQHARDAIEVAACRRLELGDEVDRAEPRSDDVVCKDAVDRTRLEEGQSGSVSVGLGSRRTIQKNNNKRK